MTKRGQNPNPASQAKADYVPTRLTTDERPAFSPEVGGDDDTPTVEDQIQDRLTWLFVFRAVALGLTLAVTFGVRAGATNPIDGFHLGAISAACLAGFASILAGGLWIRFQGTRGITQLSILQVGLDALTTTLVVWFTGGVTSGFVFLYSLAVLGAAAVLGRRGAFSAASLVGLLYTAMISLEAFGIHSAFFQGTPPLRDLLPTFFVNVLALFLVAFLAGFLSDQLSRSNARLAQAREQVFALEELAEAVLESLPSGVLTLDVQNRLLYVNRAAAELLAEHREDLVGKASSAVLPGLPPGPRPEQARLNFELDLDDVAGNAHHYVGTAASLTGLEGRTGRVVIFDDQTELRRLQQEASRHQELATVGRFAAGLAHEIRNPLAAMLGCLNLLEKDVKEAQLGADSLRMVSIVQQEAERLSQLVSAFLTYARPAPPRREDINLAILVHETVETLCNATNMDTGVDVKVDVWANPTVRCDPAHYRQVLWNLLTNAISAASGEMGAPPDGEREKKVHVTVDATERMGLVVIEDSGPGIPKEHRERIFEPFFTTRKGGTGLGMAESHQLMTAQGGRIEIGESGELGGARIDLVVPFVEFAEVSRPIPVAEGREESVRHQNHRAPSSPSLPPLNH